MSLVGVRKSTSFTPDEYTAQNWSLFLGVPGGNIVYKKPRGTRDGEWARTSLWLGASGQNTVQVLRRYTASTTISSTLTTVAGILTRKIPCFIPVSVAQPNQKHINVHYNTVSRT